MNCSVESFIDEDIIELAELEKEIEFSAVAFGKHFNSLRKINNHSLVSLSEKLSVRYQTISNWESGKSLPSIYTLKECADLFGVSFIEIYYGKNNQQNSEKKENFSVKRSNLTILVISSILFVLSIALFALNSNNKVVTFETDGGSTVDSLIVTKWSKIDKPSDPTKENYEFVGWYYNDVLWDFENDRVTSSVVLVAKWIIAGIDITFDYGKYHEKVTVRVPNGADLTQYVIEVEGYTFRSWFYDPQFNNKVRDFPKEDCILYAQYFRKVG